MSNAVLHKAYHLIYSIPYGFRSSMIFFFFFLFGLRYLLVFVVSNELYERLNCNNM